MTREELYDLVWRLPATEVARQCGVSTARLRKICSEFGVPIPTAGYWTKVAYGKSTEQPPLPPSAPNFVSRINAVLRKLGEVPLRIADEQLSDFEIDFSGMPVANQHAAASALEATLRSAAPDAYGIVEVIASSTPYVRISSKSIARVVRTFDSFMRLCDAQGFSIEPSSSGMTVIADGETFCLRIYALRTREPQPASGLPETLVLELYDPRNFKWSSRNLVEQWRDRPGRLIEQALDEIPHKLRSTAAIIKKCRDAVSGHTEHERRMAIAANRSAGAEPTQRAFLFRASEDLARLGKLRELANHLRAGQDIESSNSEMLCALDSMISEIESRLAQETLASDFLALQNATRDSSN